MNIILALGAAMLTPDASSFTINGVAAPDPEGMIPLSVATADLDGDGAADHGTLLIRCAGGNVAAALYSSVKAAREAGSGLATGKRTHVMPHVFETAGPRLAAVRGNWDLKEAKGGRLIAGFLSKKGYDHYQAVGLTNVAGLCAAATAQAATVKATKSRSNIQNN
jgi:hypothetical protein